MKLIKPYFEIIEQKSSTEDLYKHIELCGRNAYKSEDKITEDSAKTFVDKICKAKHGSVLEHGTVYLKAKTELINMYIHPEDGDYEEYNILSKYKDNKYSNVFNDGEYLYVTTNFRVLKENDWLNDLQYICKPTEFHEKRVSVRFVCSRAISHELVRHRVFTFTQESQRYCNYSKDKFGNDVTFIKPLWIHTEREEFYGHILANTIDYSDTELRYMMSLKESENAYLDLLYFDYKPEEAREVLPNSTKTDIIMTGFVSDWKHFFELRTAENAHPEMRRLAIPLQDEFIKKGYLK
jgi:thymidylate synthase (FAD)